MKRCEDVLASAAIYDGREYRGALAELVSGKYEALDGDGNRIGLFDDRRAAARAVLDAARGRT
jgi:hypothetical protein